MWAVDGRRLALLWAQVVVHFAAVWKSVAQIFTEFPTVMWLSCGALGGVARHVCALPFAVVLNCCGLMSLLQRLLLRLTCRLFGQLLATQSDCIFFSPPFLSPHPSDPYDPLIVFFATFCAPIFSAPRFYLTWALINISLQSLNKQKQSTGLLGGRNGGG